MIENISIAFIDLYDSMRQHPASLQVAMRSVTKEGLGHEEEPTYDIH